MMKRALLLLPLLAGCRPADPTAEAAPYYAARSTVGSVLGTDLVTDKSTWVDSGTGLEFVRQVPDSRQVVMKVLAGPMKGRQVVFSPECITSDRPSPSPGPGR